MTVSSTNCALLKKVLIYLSAFKWIGTTSRAKTSREGPPWVKTWPARLRRGKICNGVVLSKMPADHR